MGDQSKNAIDDLEEKSSAGDGITFKVLLHDLNQKITCKVNPDDNLWNVKRNLVTNTDAKKLNDSLNYGFFCPANAGRVGKFLGETRAIKEFSEKDLKDLQFRYKKKNYKDLPANLKKLKNVNDPAHRKSFIHAINSHRMDDVIQMLKKGHDPNYQESKTGETPMTISILSGAPTEMLVHLVAEGAHLDYRNTCEMTPLHVAAVNGKVDCIKILLELGSSANYRNCDNLTPLHCLASGRDLDTLVSCCQLLLENYSVVDVADDAGNTELHHASKQGRLLLAKKLIIYGACINRRNAVGNTPLHVAIFNNQEETAKKLLAYGADKQLTNKANYDALDAAVTVENKQLADFIQHFDSSQLATTIDKPTYHPKRKADSSRRPSMLEFLKEEQSQTLQRRVALAKQSMSCPDGNIQETSGLKTPDTGDVDKIGNYISRIFDNIQEDDDFTVAQKNSLFVPAFDNQKASSYSDVRTNLDNFDDFTDSEDSAEVAYETAPSMTNHRPRLAGPSNKTRPATVYVDPPPPKMNFTVSSASMLALALKKHLPNQQQQHSSSLHSSTLSLSTHSSPLPVVKLQPKMNGQQDIKVASIRSSPKRLIMTKQTDPHVKPAGEFHGQPVSLNPSLIKQRPSLKEIFPFGSLTNIAREGSRVLPEMSNETSKTSAAGHLPEIKFRESIYEEIPEVQVDHHDGKSTSENVPIAPDPYKVSDIRDTREMEKILDGDDCGASTDIAVQIRPEDDEVYANIGPGGLVLSYYEGGISASRVKNKPEEDVDPPKTNSGEVPEGHASQRAAEVTESATRLALQSLSPKGARDNIDSRSRWLHQQQQLILQTSPFRRSRVYDSDDVDGHLELEKALQNQRKLEKLPPSGDEDKTKHKGIPFDSSQLRDRRVAIPKHQNFGERHVTENQPLPRIEQKYPVEERPLTSFFEPSQHSLLSLNFSHDETTISSEGAHENEEESVIKRSRSVGKLHGNIQDDVNDDPHPFPSPPVFFTYSKRPNANSKRSTNYLYQLSIPQASMQKSSSYQDVVGSKTEVGTPKCKSRYPHVPPKPPQRTTSIPSATGSLSRPTSLYSPHLGPLDPRDNTDDYGEVAVRLKVSKGKMLRSQASSSPDRTSTTFRSIGMTQEEIKNKMEQLRSSLEKPSGEVLRVLPDEDIPLLFAPGRSKGFMENRAKLEKLFSHDSPPQTATGQNERGPSFKNLGSRIAVDEVTGRLYLQVEQGQSTLQEWTA